MAILEVLEYPNPILRKKCEVVDEVTPEIRKFIDDMFETMYQYSGVGLAAPQVGVLKRVIVIDPEQDGEGHRGAPLALINPKIVWGSDEFTCEKEGCLSIPDQSSEVERHYRVKVYFINYDGKEEEIDIEGFPAIVLQHEIDHLDGILYTDHISRIKRSMLFKKLEKLRKENQ